MGILRQPEVAIGVGIIPCLGAEHRRRVRDEMGLYYSIAFLLM